MMLAELENILSNLGIYFYFISYFNYNTVSSIHGVFLRNRLYLGHTGVTSFRVQFEKVGRGLLREAKRREGEWAVLVKARGDKKRLMYSFMFNCRQYKRLESV